MIRIGIVGTGGMAHGHAHSYLAMPDCRLVACCDVDRAKAEAFAHKHGIPAVYDDAAEMLARERLDGISIVTSDNAHAPVALLAIRRGIHVLCEKPLAANLREARAMASAARRAGTLTAVNFSLRNVGAAQKAAQIVASGKLGRLKHVEGHHLQSWLAAPHWGDWRKTPAFLWRMSTRHGGGGVLGDVGVHLYDLAYFLAGEFAQVACELKTFDKGVKRIGPYVLDANDSMITTVRFRHGALGVLHASRWASGRANWVGLRLYGETGGLDLDFDRPAGDQLRVCLGPKAMVTMQWQAVKCPATPSVYERFVTSIRTRRQAQTSFAGGAVIQAYLDASFRAARRGGFVPVPKV